MKILSYNKEILTATGEMMRLFGNVTILQLHDSDGKNVPPSKAKKIVVPLHSAQSSRILKSLFNPKGGPPEYPFMTLEKKNLSADLSRNAEIQHDMRMMTSLSKYDPNTHPPIPIDIGFTLTIFCKYPEDVDMIVSNFAAWFNTDVFVTSPHPKLEGKTLNHQVVWSGEVAWNWKSSLQSIEQDVIIASTDFTFKTELFAGYGPIKNTPDGVIHRVVLDYSLPDGTNYPEYDQSHAGGGGEGGMGNVMGGFFCVSYSQDFDEYAERIISNTVTPNELDYDGFAVNYYNESFDSAVMSHSLSGVDSAATSGADIYLHSYWPYAYAKNAGYDDIVEWLDEHGALKPTYSSETESPSSYEPHYPVDDKKIKIADLL